MSIPQFAADEDHIRDFLLWQQEYLVEQKRLGIRTWAQVALMGAAAALGGATGSTVIYYIAR